MKKIALMIATAAAICTAIPASAQTVVIREGGMHRQHDGYHHRDRAYRARAEYRRDRGYHRGWERGERRGGSPAVVITR